MDKKIERLKRRQIRPTTPGEFLKEDVLPELGISQVAFAKRLGVSHRTFSEVLNEHRPVSIDLAWRLGHVLGNGVGFWIRMQQTVDAWDALQLNSSKYEALEPLRKTA